MPILHFLSISGSLRAESSNAALLAAARDLTPPGMAIAPYAGLGGLPHFNPDLESDLPAAVMALRASIEAADGLIISVPEYARGLPGAFKNLLDWLVGCPNFAGKPVAIFNASPRAVDSQKALRLVLTTMAARVVEEASITLDLMAQKLTADQISLSPEMRAKIVLALSVYAADIGAR